MVEKKKIEEDSVEEVLENSGDLEKELDESVEFDLEEGENVGFESDEEDSNAVSTEDLTSIKISTSLGAYAGQVSRANLEDSVMAESDFNRKSSDSIYDENNENDGRDFYEGPGDVSVDSSGDFYDTSDSGDFYSTSGRNEFYSTSGGSRDGPYNVGEGGTGSKPYSLGNGGKVAKKDLRHGNESRLEIEGLQKGFGVMANEGRKRDKRDNTYN